MAGKNGNSGDGPLAEALAAGLSVPKAAAAAGLSERTAYRRLADPAFRARVDEARAESLRAVVGQMSRLGQAAAGVLAGLMKDGPEQVRLGATRTALEYLFKGHETLNLARQLEELRAELEGLKRHGDGDAGPAGGPAADGGPGEGGDGEPSAGQPAPGAGGDFRAHEPGPVAEHGPLFGSG
jgi:hypothetical protein